MKSRDSPRSSRYRPNDNAVVGPDLTGDILVLCVDDEPDVLELTANVLEAEHEEIEVISETDPRTGLDRLAEADVTCVVSDFHMSGMDGLEFLDVVKEDRPHLPFILFTDKGSEEIASEAVTKGVTDYVQKESGTDQYAVLANRIEQAVLAYRAQREIVHREERFRTLMEESPAGVTVIDDQGRIEYASRSLQGAHGIRRGGARRAVRLRPRPPRRPRAGRRSVHQVDRDRGATDD